MRDDEDEESIGEEDWSDIDHPEGEKGKRPDPVYLLLNEKGGIVLDPAMIDILHEKSYFGNLDESTGLLFLFPEEILIFSERNRLLAVKDMTVDEASLLLDEIKASWELS